MDQRVEQVLEKVRYTRVSKGISILELSVRADISRSQVYYLESKRKIPSLSLLFRIADALEVDIQSFFTE